MENNQDNKKTDSNQDIVEYQTSTFDGPLPHPEILAGYEKILTGAADRILKMAEEQSKHRRELEASVVHSNITNEKNGMKLAFIITVLFIILSGILIYFDKTIAGYLTLGTVIIGHAYNYINQKKQSEKELNKE